MKQLSLGGRVRIDIPDEDDQGLSRLDHLQGVQRSCVLLRLRRAALQYVATG